MFVTPPFLTSNDYRFYHSINSVPNYATIAMSGILLLTTVVSVYLVEHPRFGRRTLHIAGLVGMYFSTAMISVSMVISKVITD
jgi:hypothetical protein